MDTMEKYMFSSFLLSISLFHAIVLVSHKLGFIIQAVFATAPFFVVNLFLFFRGQKMEFASVWLCPC